ncbi:MAG: FAD-dependent oxidoreductase [Bacillota bacterium]|nr:FAD-dependent oxidoreductase [Bacillota bacterium]
MKVLIVGGVAAGASAATRLRRLDEHAEIIIFERSGYISYANCGLPYYIGDVIQDPAQLSLQTAESLYSRFRIQVKTRHEVLAVHPERKAISVLDLEKGISFEECYDKLILAPGAKPSLPPLPGRDLDRVFTLRTVEDSLRLKEFIREKQIRSAALVGGGFIGVELAENLRQQGLDVTVIELGKQLMTPFDPEIAAFIHAELRKNGIQLALEQAVEGFIKREEGIDILLKDHPSMRTDMVVLAVGVNPDTAFLKDAGLEMGMKGSIVVNEHMETSIPDIYAGGDAVQVRHFVSGNAALISLAGPANKQGRIIADNICGRESCYKGSQGSSVLKIFDLTAASTGLNEGSAKIAGFDVEKIILSPMDHAAYYPDGKLMLMKLLFEKESSRLLGAQILGYGGVDKRIDVLATAIHAGMKGTDLKDLDLAYAPPYSSAKDPVNMAGFLIDNISSGILKQWQLEELPALLENSSVTLLDTRKEEEFAEGHIPGFINIPLDALRENLESLDPAKPIYLICQSGLRSYIASRILEGRGYRAYNFSGGFRFYDAVVNGRCLAAAASPCGMNK